ncbi:hypothetical protein Tco_0953147 [Tanacetum coccineum]|uniref:Retrovirus-related Pol polyprotein from transposon TNT 1-94-like beta-barrel domain-containing protein n=1 Tax=Tanacetum coccineum TaxID=301880 RepID=A0ABQ5E1C2_9ASTR
MGFQDHAVVDSGCSSHMTGNKAYLSEYEDLNGGFVAFGSDPKGDLKRKSKKVLIFESEEFMKKKLTDFVTPIKALGEAQEEDISPTSLEAAKTLTKVASQGVSKEKSTDKGKRYRRRARSMAKRLILVECGRKKEFCIEEVKYKYTKVILAQEDSETDKEESVEAMNPTPLTTKSDSVVNWKIFQQGQRSIYQIMRENGADTVYMSFGAMLKDFTIERIHMN